MPLHIIKVSMTTGMLFEYSLEYNNGKPSADTGYSETTLGSMVNNTKSLGSVKNYFKHTRSYY